MFAFRLLALSQVILAIIVFMRVLNTTRFRFVMLALGICITAYLVMPIWITKLHPLIVACMQVAASMIPMLLAYIVWITFEDRQAPPLTFNLAALAFLIIGTLDVATHLSEGVLGRATSILFQVAKLMMVFYAAAIIWRGRESDLVLPRILLRTYFTWGLVVAVGLVVFFEFAYAFAVPVELELIGMLGIFLFSLFVNIRARDFAEHFRSEPLATKKITSPLATKIHTKMKSDQIYQNPEIRIADLAAEVNITEHRLRQAIRTEMGYRNFNQFLNRYRIEEAADRLLAEPDTQVTTIAYEIGFGSLSTFNTAFKEQHGCTPTAYRQRVP